MSFNIGINVIETNGRAAPALQGAATSVAGLLVRSERGPIDQAVRISSYPQYLSRFGGGSRDKVSSYCVEGFFQNGGREAYVVRVIGDGAQPATAAIPGREPGTEAGQIKTAMFLRAGFRGSLDPGSWGNSLVAQVTPDPLVSYALPVDVQLLHGLQPAVIPSLSLTTGLLSLAYVKDGSGILSPCRSSITVDESETATVEFSEAWIAHPERARLSEVAAAINGQAGNLVKAAVISEGGAPRLHLVTRKKGGESGAVTPSLKFKDLVGSAFASGLGLRDLQKGAPASGGDSTLQLDSSAGLSAGSFIRISDGLTSECRQIKKLEPVGSGGGRQRSLVTLDRALDNSYRADFYDDYRILVQSCEFQVTVLQSTDATRSLVLEQWRGLTLDPAQRNYAPVRINDPDTGSSFVRVEDAYVTARGRDTFDPSAQHPEPGLYPLLGGSGGEPPTPGQYRDALQRFRLVDIQLLAVLVEEERQPLLNLTHAALDYAMERGDCMFVGHTPRGFDPEAAREFGQELRESKVYGALYWPWIEVSDPLGAGSSPQRKIPPTGHVLGVYARTEQGRGIWKAPAGNEAVIRGALAVERELTETDNTDLVKNGSVNTIRRLPGAGVVVDASRTLSTDPRWLFVGTRLLFNYVKTTLRDGLRWVKQEPNRAELWSKIKHNVVTPFLLGLYRQGAFGPGKAEETFTVVCGAENNPGAEIQQGVLHLDVYFYPSRPAETIVITVGQQDGGSAARER